MTFFSILVKVEAYDDVITWIDFKHSLPPNYDLYELLNKKKLASMEEFFSKFYKHDNLDEFPTM